MGVFPSVLAAVDDKYVHTTDLFLCVQVSNRTNARIAANPFPGTIRKRNNGCVAPSVPFANGTGEEVGRDCCACAVGHLDTQEEVCREDIFVIGRRAIIKMYRPLPMGLRAQGL